MEQHKVSKNKVGYSLIMSRNDICVPGINNFSIGYFQNEKI